MRRDTSRPWLRAGSFLQLSEGPWQPQYPPLPGVRGGEVCGVLGLSLPHPLTPCQSEERAISRRVGPQLAMFQT